MWNNSPDGCCTSASNPPSHTHHHSQSPISHVRANPSSKPTAFQRLNFSLVPFKSRFMQAAIYPSVLPFSSGLGCGVLRSGGLRLQAQRQFPVFLASSPCTASASSYHSCSAAPLRWRSRFSWAAPFSKPGGSLLAFGSNSPVKRTCLRQAAYFGR